MSTVQDTKTTITLRGSTQIVVEFFAYSINSILYQRGIYPPESFVRKQKYGLSMMISNDEGLKSYLGSVLTQLSNWLMQRLVKKLVLVVTGTDSGETLERWTFDIEQDRSAGSDDAEGLVGQKSEKEIQSEIQAIVRQITASVTFLPVLEEPCTFDLLVYADNGCEVPVEWEESDPCYIDSSKSSEVRLRSFTTSVHRVDTAVSYRNV